MFFVPLFQWSTKNRTKRDFFKLKRMDMKTSNSTFGVTFYLRRYKVNQNGTMPIYMRITVNGKRLDISVKRTVLDRNWNAGKGMAKGSREEVVKLNNYLEKLRSSVVECYQELSLQKNWLQQRLSRKECWVTAKRTIHCASSSNTTIGSRRVFLPLERSRTIIPPKGISENS